MTFIRVSFSSAFFFYMTGFGYLIFLFWFILFYSVYSIFLLLFYFILFSKQFKMKMKNERKSKPSVLNEINFKTKSIESK